MNVFGATPQDHVSGGIGVLNEPYSQLTPLSGVAVQARQSTKAGTVSSLCSLVGRYGYSA